MCWSTARRAELGRVFARMREGRERAKWAGPAGCFFKGFSNSFPAKQLKQKQNKAKFNQTKFVEFVKINSTTQVTTNRTSRNLILVEK